MVTYPKVVKPTVHGSNELSRFSDTPGDASLDDLFQPLDRQRDQGAEASTSAAVQVNAVMYDGGKNELAKELKARMAQKQMENETGQRNGGKLLEFVMGLGKDVIDIDGSVCLFSSKHICFFRSSLILICTGHLYIHL